MYSTNVEDKIELVRALPHNTMANVIVIFTSLSWFYNSRRTLDLKNPRTRETKEEMQGIFTT